MLVCRYQYFTVGHSCSATDTVGFRNHSSESFRLPCRLRLQFQLFLESFAACPVLPNRGRAKDRSIDKDWAGRRPVLPVISMRDGSGCLHSRLLPRQCRAWRRLVSRRATSLHVESVLSENTTATALPLHMERARPIPLIAERAT